MTTIATPALTLRPPLPRSLYIETTSRCNSKCQTCILTFGGREPAEDLSWPHFRQIVDQFPILERVLLHGIGEPLLNAELTRMIAHLTARGARVLFNSNAISLSPARAGALIAAGLDELRVSLDATTVGTYARIRGADAFPKVVANLERLAWRGACDTGTSMIRAPRAAAFATISAGHPKARSFMSSRRKRSRRIARNGAMSVSRVP